MCGTSRGAPATTGDGPAERPKILAGFFPALDHRRVAVLLHFLARLSRTDQRFEAGLFLDGAPPPMDVLAEPLAMLGVGREILIQQAKRFLLITQHHAHERLVAEELLCRVDVRIAPRAVQHVPRAVGEAGT